MFIFHFKLIVFSQWLTHCNSNIVSLSFTKNTQQWKYNSGCGESFNFKCHKKRKYIYVLEFLTALFQPGTSKTPFLIWWLRTNKNTNLWHKYYKNSWGRLFVSILMQIIFAKVGLGFQHFSKYSSCSCFEPKYIVMQI